MRVLAVLKAFGKTSSLGWSNWLSTKWQREQQFMKCSESSAGFFLSTFGGLLCDICCHERCPISSLLCWSAVGSAGVLEVARFLNYFFVIVFILHIFPGLHVENTSWLLVAYEDLNTLFSVLKIHRSLNTAINILFRKQSWDVTTLTCKKTV